MVNNYKPFIPPSDDDPFGLNQPDLELPMPEWLNIALPAIHEESEYLAKRNANNDQEVSDSLSKRVRPSPPSPELKVIDDAAQPVILNNEASTKGYTQAQEAMIVTRLQQRQNFRSIAQELFIDFDELKQNWYQFLRLKYPHVNYDPILSDRLSIFTEAEDKEIARRIEAGDTYQDIARALNKNATQINSRWLDHLRSKYPQTVYKHTHKRKAVSIPPSTKPFPDNIEQSQKEVYLDAGTPPALVSEEPLSHLDLLRPTPLQPTLKTAFTPAEDLRIKDGVDHGENYAAIALALNREANQVNRRWNNYLKHQYPGSHYNPNGQFEITHVFTEEEDRRIWQGKVDNESNGAIARALNLTPIQISYRWNKHLAKNYPELSIKPNEKPETVPFTPQEDEALSNGIKRRLNWNQLANLLKRRSHQIEDRWYTELSKNHPDIAYNPIDTTSTSIFNQPTDTVILRLIKARYHYEEIAKELGYETLRITRRWHDKLKKENPDVSYQPMSFEDRNKPATPQPDSVAPFMDPYTYYNWLIQQASNRNKPNPPY